MQLLLNGIWDLYYAPHDPKSADYHDYAHIQAVVPGNVELDLYRAGIEPDPFFGENIYLYRKYEYYDWVFVRNFDIGDIPGERMQLRFEGLNTYATVAVNGITVGTSENMLIAHEFDITGAVHKGNNEIAVYIESAFAHTKDDDLPVWTYGEGTEYTRQRKPPSSFGWDIMPRFPSAGIWRDVLIETVKPARITQTYYTTLSLEGSNAMLFCSWRFAINDCRPDLYAVRITVGNVSVERKAMDIGGDVTLYIKNAHLWWPRGYGEQALYDAKMELLFCDRVVDCVEEKIGIRLLSVEHTMKPGNDGEFKIICNGVPILAKGSNWVPLDAMHSRDAKRYETALSLFAETECNIIRCWGGNVYEDHRFFDICDHEGFMVWQDFTMACAAYPQNETFMKSIEEEASAVIRKLRNHPSILLWAGDNECDETISGRNYSDSYNPITREILPRAVRMNDPFRMFLPSSPYITNEVPRYLGPEQHNWGPRAYFKDDFYKNSIAHFISECGYHGCPSPESLRKYIPKDQLWPMSNPAWTTHDTDYTVAGERGYNRNTLMANQVRTYFGSIPDDLESFAQLSQVVQAEAKKFFIERTRIKKWRRTGIIWWNMLDGWPQISDAIVDYYFDRKRAFRYIQRIQKKICIMVDEPMGWSHEVILGNDSRENFDVEWRVKDGDTGETFLSGNSFSPANTNVSLGRLQTVNIWSDDAGSVCPGEQRLILLEWTVNGKQYGNHFITGFPPYDPKKMKEWLEKIDRLPCGEPI